MNNFCRPIWFFLLLTLASTLPGISTAKDCKPIDRQASIDKLLEQNPGAKVLKVDERADANGCVELEIRLLIDGTVKAVIVSS